MDKTILRVLFYPCLVFLINGCSSEESLKATISRVSPDGAISGENVLIYGSSFGNNQEDLEIYFGDKTAPVVSFSDTRIEVTVPEKGGSNSVDVYLGKSGKKSNSVKFYYRDHIPLLSAIPESKGLHGEVIEITGSRFNTAANGTKVFFNDVEAKLISVAEDKVVVEAPYVYESRVYVKVINTEDPDIYSNELLFRFDIDACDSIAIAGADWTVDNSIREDIVLRYGNMRAFDSKQQISYIEIPMGDDIELGVEYKNPSGLEKTTTMCTRVGAFAGINASYFSTWGAHDYFRFKGVERVPTSGWRSSPGYVDGCIVLNGTNDLSFVKVPGGSPNGPSVPGETVVMVGPMLRYNSITQTMTSSTHNTDRHPRSAIGVTKDNKLIFIVVDGRTTTAAGVTNAQFALVMRYLGATDALNLDGGGSSTLFVRGFGNNNIANQPSDAAGERSVGNVIYAKFK